MFFAVHVKTARVAKEFSISVNIREQTLAMVHSIFQLSPIIIVTEKPVTMKESSSLILFSIRPNAYYTLAVVQIKDEDRKGGEEWILNLIS